MIVWKGVRWVALFSLAGGIGLGACGGDEEKSNPSKVCHPGDSSLCEISGCVGKKTCLDDGDGYGPCICEDAGATGGVGNAPNGGSGGTVPDSSFGGTGGAVAGGGGASGSAGTSGVGGEAGAAGADAGAVWQDEACATGFVQGYMDCDGDCPLIANHYPNCSLATCSTGPNLLYSKPSYDNYGYPLIIRTPAKKVDPACASICASASPTFAIAIILSGPWPVKVTVAQPWRIAFRTYQLGPMNFCTDGTEAVECAISPGDDLILILSTSDPNAPSVNALVEPAGPDAGASCP